MTIDNPTSRRGALKFSVAALVSGLTVPAMTIPAFAAEPAEASDPVLVLHRKYLSSVERNSLSTDQLEAEHESLRERLNVRYSGSSRKKRKILDSDTDYKRMEAVDEQLSDFIAERTDILIELMATRPTTRTGLRVKLQFLASDWQMDLDEDDPWGNAPHHVLNDALRFLGEPAI